MARIRTIKPEFWSSETIVECSPKARLLFIGLWNFADDHGVIPNKPKTIKMQIFPGDDESSESIRRMLDELSSNGLTSLYTVDNKEYYIINGWKEHQKIDRPSFKYPLPFDEGSTKARRTVDECSTTTRRAPPPGREGNGKEGKGIEEGRSPLTPPKQSTSAAPAPKPVDDREKADQELMAFAERVEAAAGSDGAKSPAWASASMTIAQLRQAGCSDEVIMAAARQAKAATVDKGKRPCGPAYVATIATNMRDDAKSAAATYAQPEQPGGYGGTPRTVEDNPLWAKWRTHLLRSDRMDELAEFKAFQSEHGHDAASERASQSAKAEGVRL